MLKISDREREKEEALEDNVVIHSILGCPSYERGFPRRVNSWSLMNSPLTLPNPWFCFNNKLVVLNARVIDTTVIPKKQTKNSWNFYFPFLLNPLQFDFLIICLCFQFLKRLMKITCRWIWDSRGASWSHNLGTTWDSWQAGNWLEHYGNYVTQCFMFL